MKRNTAIGAGAAALFAALGLGGIFRDPNEPQRFDDIKEHFKYGSIGAEERAGIPYWIWRVLPDVFPEHLPKRPGRGYERLGFIYESESYDRPIGVSYRERQVPMAGLNCAVCHTGTVRHAATGQRQIILGMPAHQFDLQSYLRFVTACGEDPRFTADNLLDAIERVNPKFSILDRLAYRFLVIPRTRKGILQQKDDFSWFDSRPPQGPGRVDTFNPYRAMFGFDMRANTTVGTADLPPLFRQKVREGLWLHWDGNNDKVEERNKSAAIGAGCSEHSLDLDAMGRVEGWIWELPPPEFPQDRVETSRVERGRKLYEAHCAACHAPGGKLTGTVTALEEIGTDPERSHSFDGPLAERMNTLGTGKPWKFTRFRDTDGYANLLLDGIWLRAPYLHNGSVPTLRDLLAAPENRPKIFYRGYDIYDHANVGFVTTGPEAEREGVRFDASMRGNSNQGHLYGTNLKANEKDDLLEFLKTL